MSTRETQLVKASPKRTRVGTRVRKSTLYPESDGKPIADNTRQFEWIVLIKKGLDELFKDDLNVFIAGDLLWYPVKGHPETNTAPDAMVTTGRPKGHRSSYKQWEEGGLAPQVVFEIWSPSNTLSERDAKLAFYERYGVEEYYTYDPLTEVLQGWQRRGRKLVPLADLRDWVSPRLKVKFSRLNGEWVLFYPNGRRFENFEKVCTARDEAERQVEVTARQVQAERTAKEAAWAKLRALGIDPESL